jgi:hypothetical protein
MSTGRPACALVLSSELKSAARAKNAHADNKISERRLEFADTNIAERNRRVTLEVGAQCTTKFERPID